MSSSQQTSQTSSGTSNGSYTVTPAQQQAVLSALGGAGTAYGTSLSTTPNLTGAFTGVQGTGTNQENTGLGALSSGANTLSNITPSVTSAADTFMAGYNPAAQTAAELQGAKNEANQVVMPGIASGAANTGNVNSSGTGVAAGIVGTNLANQYAQDYAANSSNDWAAALGNASSDVYNAGNSLFTGGNNVANSGTSNAAAGATGVTAAPYASITDYLNLLDNANAGGSGTSTGTTSSTGTTTSTPSALQVISGLLSAGGSLATGLGAIKSDRRFKKDIRVVGKLFDGTPIYTFKYKDENDERTHMGVMAQDLEERGYLDVVHDIAGIKYVDYAKL